MKYNYVISNIERVFINDELILTNKQVVDAINFSNEALQSLDEQTRAFDWKKSPSLFRWQFAI